RMAVCDKTFRLLQKEPYAGQFELIEPRDPVALNEATRFDCSRPRHRHPRETKGQDFDATTEDGGTCTDGGDCC
ncbi:MAG: methyltransferase, partial [Planctomycetes bacterium]|nr:methyltransferase [Planctomycetota bacterium]